MRYHALACDYDGTIAHHGKVDDATLKALKKTRKSGRRLLLATGRELDDLDRTQSRPCRDETVAAQRRGGGRRRK